MIPSIEVQARIAILREKAKTEELSLDEMKEAIAFLRQERMSMPPAKTTAKKPVINADDLLGELGI